MFTGTKIERGKRAWSSLSPLYIYYKPPPPYPFFTPSKPWRIQISNRLSSIPAPLPTSDFPSRLVRRGRGRERVFEYLRQGIYRKLRRQIRDPDRIRGCLPSKLIFGRWTRESGGGYVTARIRIRSSGTRPGIREAVHTWPVRTIARMYYN